MTLTKTYLQLWRKSKDFKLKGTDQKIYSLSDFKGENGTLIMFIVIIVLM